MEQTAQRDTIPVARRGLRLGGGLAPFALKKRLCLKELCRSCVLRAFGICYSNSRQCLM